jgi:chorismate mutase
MSTNGTNGKHEREQLYPSTVCRGVRGAITVTENSAEAILEATRDLLHTIVRSNNMEPEDIASVYFTTTMDLDAAYPAAAARQLGWTDVALLCGHEMNVPGGLRRCIRVLIHWNTTCKPKEIKHVYLGEAKSLRADYKGGSMVRPIQTTEAEAIMKILEGKA